MAPGRIKKPPVYVQLKTGDVFAFAGLWDEWHDKEGGLIISSTIITTGPNSLLKPVHDRMPVILRPKHFDQWISQNLIPDKDVAQMLRPLSADDMRMHTVSTKVNSVRYDRPDCIAPPEQQTLGF